WGGGGVGRAFEAGVGDAAFAALGGPCLRADRGEVGEQRLAVLLVDLRADRHLHHDVGTAGAMTILTHAGTAVLRGVVLLVAVVDQRVEAVDRDHHHVAAAAAIAAVGPAKLDELLAPERQAAVPAVTGADID